MRKTTAKQRVLAALEFARGDWVPAYRLTQWETGGSEGLRRLRELRADGYPIEGPRKIGKGATRWYRLVPRG